MLSLVCHASKRLHEFAYKLRLLCLGCLHRRYNILYHIGHFGPLFFHALNSLVECFCPLFFLLIFETSSGCLRPFFVNFLSLLVCFAAFPFGLISSLWLSSFSPSQFSGLLLSWSSWFFSWQLESLVEALYLHPIFSTLGTLQLIIVLWPEINIIRKVSCSPTIYGTPFGPLHPNWLVTLTSWFVG